ncbi:replication-relaxation family protein [Dactylosporangium sp. AC04546]|uniref:replication-relaxation family protein n=1 Tax=Dactylosporangium sp. AC04546 TaxID=2862460 RepID=UPI001EE0CD7C|nr:replication-relaxation family protein [Dactylosporangium sp. AC04546]WVK78942.1 replication-relaxation family protein [Dactylosporangium sp. AC04546]
MPTSSPATRLLALYPHLTTRDRALLALLDEHRVLTSDQIMRLQFQAMRTCQIRLRTLLELGVLERFRFARLNGGAEPWHWTLGLAGAQFRAGVTGRPTPTERGHRTHVIRLTASPLLPHLRTTNEFFVRLAHAARIGSAMRLQRWWSERTATAKFLRIRPDGHGLWTAGGRTVGCYLECDMGTEPLTRVLTKLDAYEELVAAGGPRYPVLFWLANAEREAHLQHRLRDIQPAVPVATATHDTDVAGAVWLPADGWRRVALRHLDSDHGPNTASNPNWLNNALDLTDQTGEAGTTFGAEDPADTAETPDAAATARVGTPDNADGAGGVDSAEADADTED